MPSRIVSVVSSVISAGVLSGIFTGNAIAADGPPITVAVGAALDAPKFTPAQLEYVGGWIKGKAPECPQDVTTLAARHFLEELQERHPEKLDGLISADFPARDFDSMLLRHVGAQLVAPAQATLREEIARRRVQALLGTEAVAPLVGSRDTAGLIAKIKDMSSVYYRRLVEGRIEDDDLILLLKKAHQPGGESTASAPAKPKTLTATEIVSEFSRHNQTGSALQHLRAYTIEGRLKTASGDEQQLLLFKMRPDRFRLVVMSGGTTRYIMAFDGEHYWQQVPGKPAQELRRDAIGSRRFLGEFADPLFAEENATFRRLEDGGAGDQKFNRLAVHRADGSEYVVQIDPATFYQIGRENDDRSKAQYSDFRDIGGVTMAFREELTDAEGRKGVFELTRVTRNPGLVQAFFEQAPADKPDYFDLERFHSSASLPLAKSVR